MSGLGFRKVSFRPTKPQSPHTRAQRSLARYFTWGGGALAALVFAIGGASLLFLETARTSSEQSVDIYWPRSVAALRLAADASHLIALTTELPSAASDAERQTVLQRIDGVKNNLSSDLSMLREAGVAEDDLSAMVKAQQALMDGVDLTNELVQNGVEMRGELANQKEAARARCAALVDHPDCRAVILALAAPDLDSAPIRPVPGLETVVSLQRDLFANEQRRLNLARRQSEIAGRFLFLASSQSDEAVARIRAQQNTIVDWSIRTEWIMGLVLLTGLLLAIGLRVVMRRRVLLRIQSLETAMVNWRHDGGWTTALPDTVPMHPDEIDTMTMALRELLGEITQRTNDLTRSNSELEQFAYVASHDLRQPLRMVNGYLTLLQRELGPSLNQEMKDCFAFALDGAKRMDQLVVDLLDYARIGSRAMTVEPVEMADVLEICLLDLRAQIQDCKAEIKVPDDLPVVWGDRGQVQRLFQNLLGNALKYRAPGRAPVIAITWQDRGEECQITVTDNGIGIREQDYERVFGLFQRLVSREQYEGTGIGLAICKRIVDCQGGRIWVESRYGEGSSFHVVLPKAADRFLQLGKGGLQDRLEAGKDLLEQD